MPPKKPAGGQKVSPPEVLSLAEGGDPVMVAISIIDKKARNLEKRKNKLTTLKKDLESGTNLDKDQLSAVARLNEVSLQLELIKELQKQFITLQTEHQKLLKKKQKQERQQAREAERDAERKAVAYTLRVQDILNNMGDEDKENFRTGANGAVLLTEAELTQLDELYTVLAPTRQGNPKYQTELGNASEFIQLVMEQSSKEVLDTTYKQLYDVLDRIDQSGYFDHPTSGVEEDEEEGVPDDDDYKSAEDNLTSANEMDDPSIGNYEESADDMPSVEHVDSSYIPPAEVVETVPDDVMSNRQDLQTPDVQSNMLGDFVPSAPSPTFPGLGPSPLQPVADDGFSFMHDSEVDRSTVMQQQQQVPSSLENVQSNTTPALLPDPQMTAPTMDYTQYNSPEGGDLNIQKLSIITPEGNIIPHPGTSSVAVSTVDQSGTQTSSDLATTDVATGQPSPSNETAFQGSGMAMGSAGSNMMSSAPPPNPTAVYSQQLQQGNMYGGGTMGDASGGYQQQNHYGAPLRMGSQPTRGARGNRRGGGGPGPTGPKGGVYRNGRGMQGGYDMQGGPYGGSRGYGGGGNYQRSERGGRPNYRTGGGTGQRK